MAHLADQINYLDTVSLNRYMSQTRTAWMLDPDRTEWVDDVSMWPSVDYGCIYTKFINTPGMYTAETLKSFRSHDSYAPYLAAHVQTVVYHACMWCIVHVTADILNRPL